jgi:hypothetical protein
MSYYGGGGIGVASTQNLLRNASADRRGISRAFLRGISLKECYRDAARCLKDGVTEPPAGKEARHRASAPRVCSGVASAVRGGVPGRLAPDLGFRRLDFPGVHHTDLGVHLVPILGFALGADLGVRLGPRPAITGSWLFRKQCLTRACTSPGPTLREGPATRRGVAIVPPPGIGPQSIEDP